MLKITDLNEIDNYLWEIPPTLQNGMRTPARIYATRSMLEDILDERSLEQLINVTYLPGIYKYALAMPDIHQGYGFPIGGVAAIDADEGIISPGGVGYDINCGVRLLVANFSFAEIKNKITDFANQMQRNVPSGVGRGGELELSDATLDQILNKGITWAVRNGYAFPEDQIVIEEEGCYEVADAAAISAKAKDRGRDQLGTLGAGNHFLEVQRVTEIYDQKLAEAFGIYLDQITVMIHTGSRGLGHQVCSDYVKLMNQKAAKYDFFLPDRELACAPFKSEEGQNYFRAMAAAANFAWVNRQIIAHKIRDAFVRVFKSAPENLRLIYDVAHNIAKLENHEGKKLLLHRKGATRAFGPGHADLPPQYQKTGQPVFIPGSMGTASYVLAGNANAMKYSFGSTCHGAGRRLSRAASKRQVNYRTLREQLDAYGIVVRCESPSGLVEEAPEAYKNIDTVIDVVAKAGIATKVAKLRPVAIVKG